MDFLKSRSYRSKAGISPSSLRRKKWRRSANFQKGVIYYHSSVLNSQSNGNRVADYVNNNENISSKRYFLLFLDCTSVNRIYLNFYNFTRLLGQSFFSLIVNQIFLKKVLQSNKIILFQVLLYVKGEIGCKIWLPNNLDFFLRTAIITLIPGIAGLKHKPIWIVPSRKIDK